MICPKCGKVISNQTKFCPKCGYRIEAASSVQNRPQGGYHHESLQPSQPSGGGNGPLIIVLIVLLVLLLAGGGAFYFLYVRPNAAAVSGTTEEETEEETEKETTRAAKTTAAAKPAATTAAAGQTTLPSVSAAATTAAATTAAPTAAPVSVTAAVSYANQVSTAGLLRAGISGTTESSHYVQAGYSNTAFQAFDGNPDTTWQEGATGVGINEYIYAQFDRSYAVSTLYLKLGNQRRADLYVKNVRPRALRIDLGGTSINAEFPDQMVQYALVLSAPVQSQDIRVTVTDVYPGSAYEDCAITDIEVYGR